MAQPLIEPMDDFDLFGKAPEGFTRLQWLTAVGVIESEVRLWIEHSGQDGPSITDLIDFLDNQFPGWKGINESVTEYTKSLLRSFVLDKSPRYEKLMRIEHLDEVTDSNSPWTASVKFWNKYKNVDNAISVTEENVNLALGQNFQSETLFMNWKKPKNTSAEFEEAKNTPNRRAFHGGHQCSITWVKFLGIAPVADEYMAKAKEYYGLIVSEIDEIVERLIQ